MSQSPRGLWRALLSAGLVALLLIRRTDRVPAHEGGSMGRHTLVSEPEPRAEPDRRAPRAPRDPVRRVLFGLGELLITAGLVVLLFVVYEVWVTNIFADRNNERNISTIKKQFETVTVGGGSDTTQAPNGGSVTAVPVGKGLGVLYIPRFGRDYAEAIIQGDTVPNDYQLQQGVAHYGGTQLPGQVGNFAVAGHRVGKGTPFLNLDQLKTGDAVVVETRTAWFVYRINPTAQPYRDGVPGREIVSPSGVSKSGYSVLNAVPSHSSAAVASVAYLTMTTCHPKFTAEKRMIMHATLADTIAPVTVNGQRVEQVPPAVQALFSEVDG